MLVFLFCSEKGNSPWGKRRISVRRTDGHHGAIRRWQKHSAEHLGWLHVSYIVNILRSADLTQKWSRLEMIEYLSYDWNMISGRVEKDLEGHSVAKPSAWTYASQAKHRMCQKWVLANCEHLVHANSSEHLWSIIQQLKSKRMLCLCDLWPRFLCLSFLKTLKFHWHGLSA